MTAPTWFVDYDNKSMPCKTENDAKLLARELLKKGHRVRASTAAGHSPSRIVEPHRVAGWLAE